METREEIINSDRTLECPECGYICVGFKPVEYILCNSCLKEEEDNKNEQLQRGKNEPY